MMHGSMLVEMLSRRRLLALVTVVVAGAMVYGVTGAQAPPTPPHQFFGSVNTGSAAILDGVQAPDGCVVSATNQSGDPAGDATITDGVCLIQVFAADAVSVHLHHRKL